ncbi:MAG: hypothetical protein LBE59_02120 [Nevskiaceae bacterium]|nr:hypothetical protein [Nevskiaceae bacterium]
MRETALDRQLNRMYFGEQQQRAAAQEQRAATTFDQQQQLDRIGTVTRLAQSVVDSQEPIVQTRAVLPELERLGITGLDPASLDGADPEAVRAIAAQLVAQNKPLLPPQADVQLETITGKDGRPVFVPRPQAIGQQPYQKPAGQPSSYEEFILAQRDPEFAQFLRARKDKGISITNPDGSVIQIGGDGGNIGPDELTAPTRNKLQESLVGAADELDRLNSIGKSFDPKFLTVQGRAMGAGLRIKDIAGGVLGNMTPQERIYLDRFSTFRSEANRNLSAIVNRLSGAAVSPAEIDRLKKGIPSDDDSPTQFMAKYASSVKDATRATMRANWALKNGVGVRSVNQLSQVMPLDAIDQVYEQRANQIWQSLGGTPETKQQAIQRANQEFGLAR